MLGVWWPEGDREAGVVPWRRRGDAEEASKLIATARTKIEAATKPCLTSNRTKQHQQRADFELTELASDTAVRNPILEMLGRVTGSSGGGVIKPVFAGRAPVQRRRLLNDIDLLNQLPMDKC